MQKRLYLLLVAVLALSLLFCFGALASAYSVDPVDEDGNIISEEEGTEEEATEEEAAEEEAGEEGAEEEVPVGIVPISAFVIPEPENVQVSNQALSIDGELVEAAAYNIDGSNYFKLRDLAALMTGTGSQFNVDYDAPNMIVTAGEAYTPIDGDLVTGEDKSDTCVPSKQVLLVNGEQVDILVYNIGGNNYFQLRGLGELVGFKVDYDEETRTMVVETADADDEEGEAEPPEEGDEEAGEEEAEGETSEGEEDESVVQV